MSKLSEKLSFLKGMMQGMNFQPETNDQKLFAALVDLMDGVVEEVSTLRTDLSELDDFVSELDEDLAEVEGYFDDEEEEDGCCCEECGHDDEDNVVEYECPHCGELNHFDVDSFDLDEDYTCPACKKPLFPETEEKDEE